MCSFLAIATYICQNAHSYIYDKTRSPPICFHGHNVYTDDFKMYFGLNMFY